MNFGHACGWHGMVLLVGFRSDSRPPGGQLGQHHSKHPFPCWIDMQTIRGVGWRTCPERAYLPGRYHRSMVFAEFLWPKADFLGLKQGRATSPRQTTHIHTHFTGSRKGRQGQGRGSPTHTSLSLNFLLAYRDATGTGPRSRAVGPVRWPGPQARAWTCGPAGTGSRRPPCHSAQWPERWGVLRPAAVPALRPRWE